MSIINPNYFMLDYDMESQIAIAKYIRKSWETAPLKTLIQQETLAGYTAVPEGASNDVWKQWLVTHCDFH
jgi:predicted Zn-dependent protease